MTNQTIKRPALRYFGGKWRLAPWVISHFPTHDCYVELFGGGASVLLRKSKSPIEVYNDLNSRAVNFFRVLREHPKDLLRALQLTPYSRDEYYQAHELSDDPVEDARRFAILSGQGNRGAGTIDAGGWRWMRHRSRTRTPQQDWSDLGHLMPIVERLKDVALENDHALTVLKRYDSPQTLFYVDPPYLASTRCMRWRGDAYACEMNEQEHRDLARALRNVQGIVVVSGYRSELYDELYDGWVFYQKSVTVRVRSARGRGKTNIECLWVSPGAIVQPKLV